MRYRKLFFVVLLGAELITMLLAFLSRLAIPQSRQYSSLIFIITVIVITLIDFKRRWKYTLSIVACIGVIFFISTLIDPRERRTEHVSPLRETTVIIEYDFVGRPFVYRKEYGILMAPVPFHFGPGYNETINHKVTWISERQIKLTDDYGGEWIIDL